MSKIQIQSEIDAQSLLTSISQVSVNELEFFFREINALITRKKATDKDYRDRALLTKINQTVLPKIKAERYMSLHQKLEYETLSETEHKEFMDLVHQEEILRNKRVKYLIELAQLRAITLPQLMQSLGLNTRSNG
jgi:hypothetical protein